MATTFQSHDENDDPMDKLSRLTAEDRDNLVAYLDGELPDDVTTRVESVLAQSNVARHDVELLARTYDLLDELPRPKASPDFTERTLVTAKLEEARPDFRQTQTYRLLQRSTVLVAWFAILLLCGSLSYAVTALWIPRPVDELLENYPVIERLDVYTEVGSVEFLEQLQADRAVLRDIRRQADCDAH